MRKDAPIYSQVRRFCPDGPQSESNLKLEDRTGFVLTSRPVGSFASDCERVTGSLKRAQHLLVRRIAAGGSGFERTLIMR